MHRRRFLAVVAGIASFAAAAAAPQAARVAPAQEVKLLNVSYDPTRELYEDLNEAFAEQYKSQTGKSVSIEQTHGGSSKQARAVIDGLKADVVTLALGWDVMAIEKAGLIQGGWEKELPDNASPYTSTIVFIVRKGNPKSIKDWGDLAKPGVLVITPNPKTSGGARWNFLAAWGYAAGVQGLSGGEAQTAAAKVATQDEAKAKAFIAALYRNVPVLDTGARGALLTFAQKKVGDVSIQWENEAYLAQEEFPSEQFEIVYPSVSVLAEPPVAVVDKNVDEKGTRAAAEAYLKFLYTPPAQDIIGANHYRPRSAEAAKKYAEQLPPLPLFTVADIAGDWATAQQKFFADGGVFDQVYAPKK
jgi:sulfate/thiosulfate transport system substrate-binding protein